MGEPIKARVQKAVAKIQRDALAGSADVLKWWTLMASDVACELLFGEDFNALSGEKVGLLKREFKEFLRMTLGYYRNRHL
jgi:hypothetical protein